MSIYDDVQALRDLFDEVYDKETGEVDEEKESQLKELQLEVLGAGIEKLCKLRANFIGDVDALKAEEKRLADKRKRLENKVKNVEQSILYLHKQNNVAKTFAGIFTVSTRKSTSVELADDFENKEYGTYEFKADKTKIKEAINAGIIVEGAEIKTKENLSIK